MKEKMNNDMMEHESMPPTEPVAAAPVARVSNEAPRQESDLGEQEASPEQLRRYWQQVLTGNPDTVPAEVWERAGANEPGLSREQQEYALYSAVNRSWVADHKAHSRREVLADWSRHRKALADELDVADDEREVFMALSARELEAPRREIARNLYEQAYRAGLHGESVEMAGIPAKQLSAEEARLASALTQRALADGARHREQWLPLARQLSEGLEVFTAVEEDAISAPRVLAGAPDLLQAVDELADMDADERKLVAYLAGHLNRESRKSRGDNDGEEGLLSRSVRAVRRGATSMGFGALQALNHAGVATLSNLGEMVGGAVGKSLQSGASAWDKRLQVLNEIRHLAQQEVEPLYSEGGKLAEKMFLDGMQMVPAATLSCCGGAGFAALSLSGMGESVAEARRRAPEGEQELQLAAGVVAGAVQGAIYMGINRLGGNMLEQTIVNFMKARGSNLLNYSLAGMKSMAGVSAEGVKLMLAGKAAAATELGVHELAARAAGTASNIDWEQFGDNLTDIEVNMREAAAMLPFLLIGSGRMALRHFRSADNVLGSGQKLLEWGVESDKVEAILKERRPDIRNELLREAVCESDLWNSPRYSMDIMRSMQLLNLSGLPLFKDSATVRDFLRLPADFAPGEARKPATAAERTVSGVQLRESWEKKAGLWADGSREEATAVWGRGQRGSRTGRGRYKDADFFRYDNPVPSLPALHNNATYSPGAEVARRRLLGQYFDSLGQDSYRMLLQVFGNDYMTAANGKPVGELSRRAESMRREYIDNVCHAVLQIAGGVPQREAFNELAEGTARILSRFRSQEQGPSPEVSGWLRHAPDVFLSDIAGLCRRYDSTALQDYPEVRDFYRLLENTRIGTAVITELLPMSEDFQTMLSRGMSPGQAYEAIILRELGYKPPALATQSTEAMSDYMAENAAKAQVYMGLTGAKPEQQTGDDGKTYYRIRRPDGSMTRWHETEQLAFNDLAANASLTFMPFRTSLQQHWWEHLHDPQAALSVPRAGERVYSGYDQLCSIALKELAVSWLEDASHLQPGAWRERRMLFTEALKQSSLRRPVVQPAESDEQFEVESYSTLTPLSLAQSRFVVYWARQLASGLLPDAHAQDFLTRNKVSSELAMEGIRNIAAPLPYPRSRDVPLNQTPPPNLAGMRLELAQELGTFTLNFFLSRLSELNVPESVKIWYATAPFAPETEKAIIQRNTRLKLGFKPRYKQTEAVSFVNRQTGITLREMSPTITYYREHFGDGAHDELIDMLLPAAMGQDTVRQVEQAWGHSLGGAGIFSSVSEDYWNLLRFPRRGWAALTPERREEFRNYLHFFCEHNLLSRYRRRELSEKPIDVVEAAMDNLEAVLRVYPDLHRYSYLKDDDSRVKYVEITQPVSVSEHVASKEGGYDTGDIKADYTISYVDMPPFIAKSPEVQHALLVLDLLRAFPQRLPVSSADGILWQGEIYGGRGKAPQGLEHWRPTTCLNGVRNVLFDILSRNAHNQKTEFELGGVKIPMLSQWQLENPVLDGVTVYRPGRLYKQSYRLMPGLPDAEEVRSRLPYVVGVNKGAYVEGSQYKTEQEFGGIQIPLHYFKALPVRELSWLAPVDIRLRSRQIHRNLEELMSLAERGLYYSETTSPANIGLLEITMRLFEDSGFSERLESKSPDELSLNEARWLNLASRLLACLAAPEMPSHSDAVAAFAGLQQTLDELRNNPARVDEMVRELVMGNVAPGREHNRVEESLMEADLSETRMSEVREIFREFGYELPEDFLPDERTKVTVQKWYENLVRDGLMPDEHNPGTKRKKNKRIRTAEEVLQTGHFTREWVENLSRESARLGEQYERKLAEPGWLEAREDAKRRLQQHRQSYKRGLFPDIDHSTEAGKKTPPSSKK